MTDRDPQMDIAFLDLNTRAYNALRRHRIYTIGDLYEYSEAGLLRTINNFGVGSMENVRQALRKAGLPDIDERPTPTRWQRFHDWLRR